MRSVVVNSATTDKLAGSWQARALKLTKGNQSLAGCVLIACLGKAPDNPPRFVGGAVIDRDGHVRAPYQERSGDLILGDLGHVDMVRDSFRRMADKLGLLGEDRLALMDALKQWIVEDARVNPDLGDTANTDYITKS